MKRIDVYMLTTTLAFSLIVLCTSGASEAASSARVRTSRPAATRVSFDETFERYPSPFAVLQQLRRIAPSENSSISEDCRAITEVSAPLIGTIDPLQGSALEQEPGALFYQHYRSCVLQIVRSAFDGAKPYMTSRVILGPELAERLNSWAFSSCSSIHLGLVPGDDSTKDRCARYESDIAVNAWVLTKWPQVEPQLRRAILERFMLYLLGPEPVLLSRRYFGPRNAFGRDLPTYESLVDFLDERALALDSGGANLVMVYFRIAVLLRLGPGLRS